MSEATNDFTAIYFYEIRAPVSRVATHSRIKPVIRFSGRGRPGPETVSHLFLRALHNWQQAHYLVTLSKIGLWAPSHVLPPKTRPSPLVTLESGTSFGRTSGTPRSSECPHFFGVSRAATSSTQPDVRPARVVPRARLTCPFSRSTCTVCYRVTAMVIREEELLSLNYSP